MLAENWMGTVAAKDEQGYYVDVFRDGQVVRYGPMHYVSSTGEAIEFLSGDPVVISTLLFRDQYVILGKYIDTPAGLPIYEDTEPDPDGDGVVIIAGSEQPS